MVCRQVLANCALGGLLGGWFESAFLQIFDWHSPEQTLSFGVIQSD
jgi:hypothetical protein